MKRPTLRDLEKKGFTLSPAAATAIRRTTAQTAFKKPLRASAPLDEYEGMNGTERAYAGLLEQQKRDGKVLAWDFEPEKFKLAKRTYYTPDFRVILPDHVVQFHETKGFWTDDARVKIKVAAALHPYQFIAVFKLPQKKGGGWRLEPVERTTATE